MRAVRLVEEDETRTTQPKDQGNFPECIPLSTSCFWSSERSEYDRDEVGSYGYVIDINLERGGYRSQRSWT